MVAGGNSYPVTVAQRFRAAPRPMGTALRGAAGSCEQGVLIQVGADVATGRLHKVGFRAFACPHIIAGCDLLAEQLEGQPVEALLEPALLDALKKLEIPAEKAGKILILQDALQDCYAAYTALESGSPQ